MHTWVGDQQTLKRASPSAKNAGKCDCPQTEQIFLLCFVCFRIWCPDVFRLFVSESGVLTSSICLFQNLVSWPLPSVCFRIWCPDLFRLFVSESGVLTSSVYLPRSDLGSVWKKSKNNNNINLSTTLLCVNKPSIVSLHLNIETKKPVWPSHCELSVERTEQR